MLVEPNVSPHSAYKSIIYELTDIQGVACLNILAALLLIGSSRLSHSKWIIRECEVMYLS
jgi:hypothetical protein